jgi:flagellar motility protein MotE (MotC chaperone)
MSDKKGEDITDLTGDVDIKDKVKVKSKEKKKKDKEPGNSAPEQTNVGKPVKKGKARGEGKGGKLKLKFNLKFILISIMVLLVAGFAALLASNLFEVRDIVGGIVKNPILSVLAWFEPEFRSIEDEFSAKFNEREAGLIERENGLDKREAGIVERENELDSLKTSLDKQESQLDRRSVSLDRREEQMDQTSDGKGPVYRQIVSEQDLADMQSLGRSYAQMAPETAAAILTELKDEQYVAAIIYYMAERNAAAILAVMEPAFAARITELLIWVAPITR